jgi:hypothetical protein
MKDKIITKEFIDCLLVILYNIKLFKIFTFFLQIHIYLDIN